MLSSDFEVNFFFFFLFISSTNQSAVPQPEKSFYVFVAIYAAQRLPILVLLVFIVLNINPEEGPKWSTKFLLIIGMNTS